ncbi:MAG: hypothetical protein IPK18_06200 [Sphingobacteriales bacterium]|nr:MAG: hypothetical protein IPK18_06200 [Sphingobacteriales bacterium]
MELEKEIEQSTLQLLALKNPELDSFISFRQYIIKYINELINSDFQYLMFLLYRIDVSEERIKTLLSNNTDVYAAEIITDLILERQKQKAISRQQFKSQQHIVDDEEAW